MKNIQYRSLYYHQSSLKKLLKLIKNTHIKECINERLRDFSPTIKGSHILGWRCEIDININNIKFMNIDGLFLELHKERSFLLLCCNVIKKHYKELGIESLDRALTRINNTLDLLVNYKNNTASNQETNYMKELESILKLAGLGVTLIGSGYGLYKKIHKE